MKKLILLLFLIANIFITNVAAAQNPSVESSLKRKYSLVQFHKECGGWYLIGYESNGEMLYGFADANGNVIASEARKYKLHCGFIELYMLDQQKYLQHEQWKRDIKQYEKDYAEYKRIKTKHESNLKAYEVKYEAARKEAESRWNYARNVAMEKAKRQAAAQQAQMGNTSILGSILGGIASGVSIAAAANNIKFEPFLNDVLAERDLLVKPSAPYNPIPKKPKEPETGFYWGKYSLKQPDLYGFIDFDKITESGNFADVRKDGKWGLVDSYMREVIPCVNNTKVLQSKVFDDFLIRSNGYFGVIDKNGKFVIKPEYRSIKVDENCYLVQDNSGYGLLSKEGKVIMPCIFSNIKPVHRHLLCEINGEWGVYTKDYQELYPCQFQDVRLEIVNADLMLFTKQKGLWGAIKFSNGEEMLPNKYSSIKQQKINNKTYLAASQNGFTGIYNDNGTIIIPSLYTSIMPVNIKNTTYIGAKNEKSVALYEENGIPVIAPDKYTSFSYVKNGDYFEVKNKGLLGICSAYGDELVPCRYTKLEMIQSPEYKYFKATKEINGLKYIGFISILGSELFPFIPADDIQAPADWQTFITFNTYSGIGAIDYNGQIIVPVKKKNNNIPQNVMKLSKKNPNISKAHKEKTEIIKADYNRVKRYETDTRSEHSKFSFYAKNYVERIINEWQKKGEFEKMDSWRKRVNQNTLNQKIFKLTKDAQDGYIKERLAKMQNDNPVIVGSYDPDNETFRVRTKYSKEDILVSVSPDDAQEFKASFNSLSRTPQFFIENDSLALSEYTFALPSGNKYKYNNESSLTHSVAEVNYNLESIDINTSNLGNNRTRGKQTISTGSFIFGTSDVDVNIPNIGKKANNTFAVIIANENYENEKKVDFAFNDGQVFRDYCLKTLGLPAENVHFKSDATLNSLRYEINWIKNVTKNYPDSKIIFYYAGHGVPDDVTKEAYLLPTDGYITDSNSGYKLSELYKTLSSLPAENIIVLLDACFSGVGRDNEMLASVRGVRVKPKLHQLSGNIVVISATSDSQTAHPYKEQSHGLFTYYLLKAMQEANNTNGINLGYLFDYVSRNVAQRATLIKNTEQTPTVSTSPNLKNVWKEINL